MALPLMMNSWRSSVKAVPKEDMKTKMSILMLVGRRWFNRGPGNTYHSCEIYVDGNCVHKIGYAYGYGSQYEWNALAWLEENGYMPGRIHSGNGSAETWRYFERNKIKFTSTVSDVQRKKDL